MKIVKALLDNAKKQNRCGLHLWVFEQNLSAIRFCERMEYQLVEKRGMEHSDNEEKLPDRKYFFSAF